jgi:hypothetical protein
MYFLFLRAHVLSPVLLVCTAACAPQSPMMDYLDGIFMASWKLSPVNEDRCVPSGGALLRARIRAGHANAFAPCAVSAPRMLGEVNRA